MAQQLAQVNIARMLAPLDDPIMKEFVDFLAPINQLAEESPGFIWRLKDEEGSSAVGLDLPYKDDMLIINMSVWEDIPALKHFVYQTVHSYFVRSSKKWFKKLDQPHTAMWWVEHGHQPNIQEAFERLAHLDQYGPGERAFTFAHPY